MRIPDPIRRRLPWVAALAPHGKRRPSIQAVVIFAVGVELAVTLLGLNRPAAAAALAMLALSAFASGFRWPTPSSVVPTTDLVDTGEPVALAGTKGTILPLPRGVHQAAPCCVSISPLGLTWNVTRTVAVEPPVWVSPVPAPAWAADVAQEGALTPWAPGEPARRLALAASARATSLVVRSRSALDTHPPLVDVHLDREQDAGAWLSRILDELRSGTVTVRSLRGGVIVTSRIGSRDDARRVMAGAEVGPWPG